MPVPDQTLTADPPMAKLSATLCHHQACRKWQPLGVSDTGRQLRDELLRTVCVVARLSPEAMKRRNDLVASNPLGVWKRWQRGAVTLVGTGYSPHEGVSGVSGRAIRALPAAVRCNRQDALKPERLAADTESRLLKLPIAPFILAKWFELVFRASSTTRWDEGGWAIAGSWKMPGDFRRKRERPASTVLISRQLVR